MRGWRRSAVCRLTLSGAERAPVRAAQVMNGDSGDGGVDGIGNVAVRTAHPMVGGWERDMLCVATEEGLWACSVLLLCFWGADVVVGTLEA